MLRHPWLKKPDIIQLFNTHGGYFSHKILPELSKIAPIVWRLSDMWPMTPHSAYAYGCECYKKGPEDCVCELDSYPPIYADAKRKLWDVKSKIYSQCNITVVAPSSWIEKIARASLLLGRFPIVRIPNGINLDVFKPYDKAQARKIFGIDPKAKVILFVAHGLDNNPRKGSNLLIEALKRLGYMENTLLFLAGEGGQSFVGKVPLLIKMTGYVKDQNVLAQIYSAADIIVVPSVVENLPNNLLEALACGLPAVAFDAGGISDAVKHMETGYLAKQGDSEDFAKGIELLLRDDGLRRDMAINARKLAEAEFDQKREAKRFEKLYIELCSR